METTEKAEDRLLPTKDAAALLGFQPDTLKTWRKEKRGPDYIKLPGKILYAESALKKYLQDCTVTPGESAA